MNNKNDVSFEVLHLITILYKKFQNVYSNCEIKAEEIYILAYLNSFGKPSTYFNRPTKILQRGVLKQILINQFSCDKNSSSDVVVKMCVKDLVYKDQITLDEKRAMFGDGQTTIIGLTDQGKNKLNQFTINLEDLYNNIIDSEMKFFDFPDNHPQKGFVVMSLLFFLNNHRNFKKLINPFK